MLTIVSLIDIRENIVKLAKSNLHNICYLKIFLSPIQILNISAKQCSRFMTFWYGSGSADPCLFIIDPDSAIFVIDPQEGNKKLNFV
jgi:hypothetical protein